MIENQRYVLTQDTTGLMSKIKRQSTIIENPDFQRATDNYLMQIGKAVSLCVGNDIKIDLYKEDEIETQLVGKVKPLLQQDNNTLCICLDRYLLSSLEDDSQLNDRFIRFGICRNVDGDKMPRQGWSSFEKQVKSITTRLPGIVNKKIVIVDDGIFSGGTVRDFLKIMETNGYPLDVVKVIGFIGNDEAIRNDGLPPVDISNQISGLYEWVDLRDFSPLGGRTLSASRNNQVTSSIPYLYPWSNGESASLSDSPFLFTVSERMISQLTDVIREYEGLTGGKPLTFRELVSAGFPLPTNKTKTIPVSINERVVDYLQRCKNLIRFEREREVYIFDMDGTLYGLDGKRNGFKGSSLESAVRLNALRFIMETEGCDVSDAESIYQQGITDSVGLSVFLSKRYGISRADYFNSVWNVDPSGIVQDFDQTRGIIQELKRRKLGGKFVLLTSAPRVWAEKVLDYLGIRDCFEVLYTGEQYGKKEEIFTILSTRYDSRKILSIGDQKETDIEPAKKLGISTLWITGPKELFSLIPDE